MLPLTSTNRGESGDLVDLDLQDISHSGPRYISPQAVASGHVPLC
jgi:hypothetical protein